MWCYRRMLRISWTEKRTNESILDELQTRRELLAQITKRKMAVFGHAFRNNKCNLVGNSSSVKRWWPTIIRDLQWRIVGSRGPGARTSVGPSAMVRPNVYHLGGGGSPPAGSGPGQSPEGKRILATTYSKLAENQISWSPSTPIIPI